MILNRKSLIAFLCACASSSSPSSPVQVVNGFSYPTAVFFGIHSKETLISTSTSTTTDTTTQLHSASIGEDVSSSKSNIIPDMKAYAAGYGTAFQELPFKVCEPSSGTGGDDSTSSTGTGTGTLPSDLVGTYFKSGPAMFSAGSLLPPKKSLTQPKVPPVPDGEDKERMVKHPFEGDGAILGVTFAGDGKAIARYRYVRTTALTRERKKGKKLYRGMESTREEGSSAGGLLGGQGNDFPVPLFKHHLQSGLNKNRKNTSNTRAIYWSKKLLTLWEGGLPYKLDALALSTEGKSQLGGVLKETDPFSGKAAFDPIKDRMLFYSNIQDSKSSMLTLYEFNSKFRVASKTEYKLPGLAVISDFAVTEKYAIFVQPPIATNGMQFMMSKEPAKSLKVEQGEALLHLVKRGSTDMKTIPIPIDGNSDADLQFCNAYEEDGKVVFDVIRSDSKKVSSSAKPWPWVSSIDDYEKSSSRKSLWRYTVQIGAGIISKECITDKQTYFGVINPSKSSQKSRYVYAAVGADGNKVSPPQGIVKIDTDTKETHSWYPEEFEFCGEPMYAPRKDENADSAEDNGYILSVLFNGVKKESELVVLNASDIAKGPVSRLPLGIAIPHGLHGTFASNDECNWSAEEIERRAKLSDKMESRGNSWNEVKSDFSGLGLRLDDFEEYFGEIL